MILGRAKVEAFDAVGCEFTMLFQSFVCKDIIDSNYDVHVVEVKISKEAGVG